MDNRPWIYKNTKPECVLKCKDPRFFYKFPRTETACLAWLARIGLKSLPPTISTARVCNNHFSERMFAEGGRKLTRDAIPDINIPGLLIDRTPDGNFQIVKPRPIQSNVNLAKIPRIVERNEIITSRASRCFLRCKDARHTYRFPVDELSRDVWVKKLGLNQMPPKSSTARICNNHFSARMFCTYKHTRLTRCAIPDINLPGQTVFTPEDGDADSMVIPPQLTEYLREKNSNPADDITDEDSQDEDVQIRNMFRSMTEATDVASQPEILINSIENIQNVINQVPSKEGILHVFQPGIEERPEESTEADQQRVALPENVVDAESECVLKCQNTERLFRFPTLEANRQLWLKKIGLTHCFFNTRICDKHFSDEMFVKSKKRLAKFAFPDLNISQAPVQPPAQPPRIKDTCKNLNEYRLLIKDKHVCDVIELPQYICVLTVLKGHTEVGAVVNGIKYVQHKIDENIPKREREVQVDAADLKGTANVAIAAEDFVDDMKIDVDVNYEKVNWLNMFKSHVFSSKTDMYECLICGEISVGYACNLKHLSVHNDSSSLCFQCGRVFSSQQMLKMHENDKHMNHLRKALRCPKMYCKKAFHSRRQLHHHVDEHIKRTEHKCNKCLRVFSSSLKLHCHRVACRNYWSFRYARRTNKQSRARIK